MRLKRTPILAAVAAVMAAFIAAGCGGKAAKTNENDTQEAELVVAITDDSGQKNPYHTNFFTVGRFLSGSLMRAGSRGGWHPQAASSVEWTEDGTALIVTVNAAHRFSDGSLVRATDIAASINAHADPDIGSPASAVLKANGFISADINGESKVHVNFQSAWTPALNFVRQLSIWPEPLVSKIKANPKDVKISDDELIGSGTHRLTKYVPNEYAVLTPLNGGPVIRVKKFSDDAGVLTEFEEGNVDLAYAEPRKQRRYAKLDGARVMTYPYPEVVTMAFNMETTKDRNMREALTRATDAEVYRLLVARDGSEQAGGRIFCGPDNGWNAPDAEKVIAAFDIDAAKRLLDKDYPVRGGGRVGLDGKPVRITIVTYDSTEYPILAERLAADWKRILQIEVDSQALKASQFNDVIYRRSESISSSDWHVVIAEWPYQLADFEPSRADSLLDTSVPSDKAPGRNIIGLRDETVSSLIRQADSETDAAKRMTLYHRVHRHLLNERVIVPLYVVHDSWVASGRVEGFANDEPYMKHFIFRWSDKLSIKK